MPRAARARTATVSAGLAVRPRLPRGEYAAAVLEAVERVPRGRVVSYGDVAEMLGTGSARAVGNAMHHVGHETHWWRVVLSTGELPPNAPEEARARLLEEGVPLRGDRVDMAAARWDGTPA